MNSKLLAFAGSARKESYNKKLVELAAKHAREFGAEVTVIDLANYTLPMFSEDLEGAEGPPTAATELYELFVAHDGFLISSPEYNSSLTALLKNTIDWVSRPRDGQGPLAAFSGKVAGLMSASPGRLGGLRGLTHLRTILASIGTTVLPSQVAVGAAFEAFDSDGGLTNEGLGNSVKALAERLAQTCHQLKES